jgi:hypothetical protein
VQNDPIKSTLTAPGTKRLRLKYDGQLSSFAFNSNSRRYITETEYQNMDHAQELGRGLHSSTFQLNLIRFGHTSPCPPV